MFFFPVPKKKYKNFQKSGRSVDFIFSQEKKTPDLWSVIKKYFSCFLKLIVCSGFFSIKVNAPVINYWRTNASFSFVDYNGTFDARFIPSELRRKFWNQKQTFVPVSIKFYFHNLYLLFLNFCCCCIQMIHEGDLRILRRNCYPIDGTNETAKLQISMR